MERYDLEVLEHSYHSYSEPVWTNQGLTFCPGLNYRVTSARFPQKEGLQMWFRIEVAGDGYLSAGFCLVNMKAGEHGEKVKVNDDAVNAVRGVEISVSSSRGMTGGLSGASPTASKTYPIMMYRISRP